MLLSVPRHTVKYQVRSRKVNFSSSNPITAAHSCLSYFKNVFKHTSYWLRLSIHTANRHLLQTVLSYTIKHKLYRVEIFFLFCWPCISVHLFQYLTNLMHKMCFTISFISRLYVFRAHVLIIRRSKLHHTASRIITPIGVMIPEILIVKHILCVKLVKYWDKKGWICLFLNKLLLYKCYKAQIAVNSCKFSKFSHSEFSTN